ncbi:MAG TPA: hypothetical protein VK788_06770 [Terriglobales bacterium]|jgi:hypothetical protein|nr:hypothetical protein [Terriglobales bacterium]
MNFSEAWREATKRLLCDKCLAMHEADPYGENGTIIADFCPRCREKMGRQFSELMVELVYDEELG